MSYPNSDSSRDKILAKIADIGGKEQAHLDIEVPKHILVPSEIDDKAELFKMRLSEVNGEAYSFSSKELCEEFLQQELVASGYTIIALERELKEWLSKKEIPYIEDFKDDSDNYLALTLCEYLIAQTGSIIIKESEEIGAVNSVFPTAHYVLASKKQIVEELGDALPCWDNNSSIPSVVSIITGPARTADIEKTLIIGAHGSRYLKVFIYEE